MTYKKVSKEDLKKQTKIPWWNLPQKILDKAIEDGVEYTKVEWFTEVNKDGKRLYAYRVITCAACKGDKSE